MSLPTFTMRQLLEAGVHFGHNTRRWNPKMKPYIFGERGGIHVIDLQQTVPMLSQALEAVRDTVANGGRVLFVGTKRQASEAVAEAAKMCGQYYVNKRWLGGTLTNWKTITDSIKRLRDIESKLDNPELSFVKKERLSMQRQREKLELALGGIREMGGVPDIMVVIDVNKEDIAIKEAQKIGIPVVAVLDTNSDPDGITFPIPGNDDASRAIKFYCNIFAAAVLSGIQADLESSGKDIGAEAEPALEAALAGDAEEEAKASDEKKDDAADAPLKASASA